MQSELLALRTTLCAMKLAAMMAGEKYTGTLSPAPILDVSGSSKGKLGNSSFADAAGVFLNRKKETIDLAANGDYWLNEENGLYELIAGATAAPLLTWLIKVPQMQTLTIIEEGEVEVVIAGTPVTLPSNPNARAVQIFNNNETGVVVAVGLPGTVDAETTPVIGISLVLSHSKTDIIFVKENSNEIAVDAGTAGTKLTYHILG